MRNPEIPAMSLNGDWRLTGTAPDGNQTISLTGRVPGNVHPDLLREGHIRDPFQRDQAVECQWVEQWSWVYEREFSLPADFRPEWAVLRFDGLDTFAEIVLNGTNIATTDNMFVPHEFEIGALLNHGTNSLRVKFGTVHEFVKGKPHRDFFACFCPEGERVYVRKMQCAFGWDWVHRFVTAGIWQPVTLSFYREARITDLFIYTKEIAGNEARLHYELSTELRGARVSAQLELFDPSGNIVWSAECDLDGATLSDEIRVAEPSLWWPMGHGNQCLYTARVRLIDDEGTIIDRKDLQIGIRTFAIEEITDADGSSFTMVVNGRRIFVKGGNWVPADPFPSQVTQERYDRLIGLARDSGLNMLRAWGGGIYEPQPFWDACNQAGVMVSQDFLLACAHYPEDDPEFRSQLRVEFEKAIRMLRNNPCLIFWCGDNELGLGKKSIDRWNGRKIAEEITGPLCAKLDPSRPFRLTSPYGGELNNAPSAGDCHYSPLWDGPQFLVKGIQGYRALIDEHVKGRFLSESGTLGAPPLLSLLKFMDESDLTDSAMWEFHTKDNPYSGLPLTLYQNLEQMARILYGESNDLKLCISQKEYVQYDLIRLICESLRRRKFYCSGVQFWMFNDCWPACGWSVVDYYGFPKAGWYGMKAGFRPVIAAIARTDSVYQIWVSSDACSCVKGEMTLRVQPWAGPARWQQRVSFEVNANEAVLAADFPVETIDAYLDSQSIFVCDLVCETGEDRAYYYRGMPAEMRLSPALVRSTVDATGSCGTILLETDTYARVVQLEAELDFSDNYFDLLPGEKKTISYRSPKGNHAGNISVRWWNEERRLSSNVMVDRDNA